MPRKAREKSTDAMYHVMSRSISEKDMFQCDADRDHYLDLLQRYKSKFHCSIYAYCLMDNHVHIFINPNGYDISGFMHCLNTAYLNYFNNRYDRHGHLLQGRFASRIVRDDTYALTLMAYIHNNPADLPGYSGCEDTYRYSSYGIYTGRTGDDRGIVDTGFLLGIFSRDMETARRKCREFTGSMKGTGIMTVVDDSIILAYTENEYRSERKLLARDEKPGGMMQKLAAILGEEVNGELRAKYIRKACGTRAFVVYVLRVLCGYTYGMICEYIGCMSVSGISRLFREGFRLAYNNPAYRNAFDALIQ